MNYININNIIFPEEKALILVKDRGFRFGDGVFETCRITNGVIYNFEAHLKRLEASLDAIKINSSFCYLPKLEKFSYNLITKNKVKNGFLRISISRGIGSFGYLPQKNIKPTLVIETLPETPKPKTPVKLWVSKIEKPSLKSLPVNYKLANGLNSTLAKIEATDNSCFDSLILNNKNQICETSSANIFWVENNILYTPHSDCGCLLGTIREKIIQISPIKIKMVKAKLNDLLNADEAFISNIA